jgi:predicted DNA-binding transcriptional regulator AlpA
MVGTKTEFLPRGLRREDAAAYIGVSPATFDELVKAGRMPQPKRIGKRTIWDRRQLDASFEDLPDRGDGSDWDEAICKVKHENQT